MMRVFLVLLSITSLTKVDGCEPNCGACDDVHDIAVIKCDGVRAPCSVDVDPSYQNEDGEVLSLEYLVEGITDITAGDCRKKCEEQSKDENAPADKKCKFFHWEKGHPAKAEKKTTCSLKTTCGDTSGLCENYDCVSGELGCNDACEKVTPCTLEKALWNHDKFHVICTDPTTSIGDVNIYTEDKEIADGTICSTVRKCSEWEESPQTSEYFRKLAVYCDGTKETDGHGTWTNRPDTGSQALSTAMVEENQRIVEQSCEAKCPDLALTEYLGQYWASLICDTPLEADHTLKDPNHCILLCDNHLKMEINCEYDRDGTKDWRNSAGEILTDAEIKC